MNSGMNTGLIGVAFGACLGWSGPVEAVTLCASAGQDTDPAALFETVTGRRRW